MLEERENFLEEIVRLNTQVDALQEQLQFALDTLEQLLSPPMLPEHGHLPRLVESSHDKSRNERQKFMLLKELLAERSRNGSELIKELRKHREDLRKTMQTLRRKTKSQNQS